MEIFPLDGRDELNLPESLGTVQRSNDVLEGVVSDDSCRSDPCVNGGNCTVTWNDFLCLCPSGFKGKTCSELEFCAIHSCPAGGECQNLNDGYECLTSATFNGVNTTVQYSYSGNGPLPAGTIQLTFRSRQGGTLLIIQNESRGQIKFFRLDLEEQGMVTRWIGRDETAVSESLHEVNQALNGSWHTVTLNFTTIFGAGSTNASALLADLVAGQIMLGGSGTVHSIAERDVDDLGKSSWIGVFILILFFIYLFFRSWSFAGRLDDRIQRRSPGTGHFYPTSSSPLSWLPQRIPHWRTVTSVLPC